jgi:hypothetical protein
MTSPSVIKTLFLALAARVASATLVDCGSRWPLQFYSVDPPTAVGTGQNVTLSATFRVPDGTAPITRGDLRLRGNALLLFDTETVAPLCDYLLCPLTAGIHTLSWTVPFPEGVYGRVQTTLSFQDKLCLRWTAFATGRPSNETNRFNAWLYS